MEPAEQKTFRFPSVDDSTSVHCKYRTVSEWCQRCVAAAFNHLLPHKAYTDRSTMFRHGVQSVQHYPSNNNALVERLTSVLHWKTDRRDSHVGDWLYTSSTGTAPADTNDNHCELCWHKASIASAACAWKITEKTQQTSGADAADKLFPDQLTTDHESCMVAGTGIKQTSPCAHSAFSLTHR